MIPKIIHYCWFGEQSLPKIAKKCIASWKKYCPDYQIIEWNESNSDFNRFKYASDAFKEKKYAFVSDVIRFYALLSHGGIYLDIDVELIKNIDSLLLSECFMGFETNQFVAPGLIIGSIKNGKIVKEILEKYNSTDFYNKNGSINLTTVGQYTTDILKNHGLETNGKFQNLNGITIYPIEWFNPYDIRHEKKHFTKNTVSIHHFEGSWLSQHQKRAIKRTKIVQKLIGKRMHSFLFQLKSIMKKRIEK